MSLTLPLFAQDQSYPPWMLRRLFNAQNNPGVGNPLVDFYVSPGSGLGISVASGDAFVQQNVESTESSASDLGLYYVFNDGAVSASNSISAPVSNPRIDRVVLRVYDVIEQSLSGSSRATIEWVTGTETVGATLANLYGLAAAPANTLTLAYVLQTVGESSIAAGNILNIAQSFTGELAAGDIIMSPSPSRKGAVLANGVAYSRVGYPNLFAACTTSFTATSTASSTSVTNVPASVMSILQTITGGATSGLAIPISSSAFSGALSITAFSGTTITLSSNATTGSSTSSFVICPFGAGDGLTTFNVPNLMSRSPIGVGTGSGLTNRILGYLYGEENHVLTVGELAAHAHTITDPAHSHGLTDPGHSHGIQRGSTSPSSSGSPGSGPIFDLSANSGANYSNTQTATTNLSMSTALTGITINNNGSNSGHNTLHPVIGMFFYIKL